MKIYPFMIWLFFASSASAYTISYSVDDYNTLQPIDGALITLTNATSISNITDAYGEAALFTSTAAYYTVSVTHSGYAPYASYLNSTNDSTEHVYLAPSSHEGIIRLYFVDLTLGDHRSCIFFKENGRIMGCYARNDSVILHTNMNYTYVPQLEKTDLLLSKKGLQKYSWGYLGIAVGAIAFFAVVMLIIGFLWRIGFKK